MKSLEDQSVDIPCPQCGQKTAKSVGWLKTQTDFACPGCGATISVNADELRSGLKRVEDALASLQRKLGKRRQPIQRGLRRGSVEGERHLRHHAALRIISWNSAGNVIATSAMCTAPPVWFPCHQYSAVRGLTSKKIATSDEDRNCRRQNAPHCCGRTRFIAHGSNGRPRNRLRQDFAAGAVSSFLHDECSE